MNIFLLQTIYMLTKFIKVIRTTSIYTYEWILFGEFTYTPLHTIIYLSSLSSYPSAIHPTFRNLPWYCKRRSVGVTISRFRFTGRDQPAWVGETASHARWRRFADALQSPLFVHMRPRLIYGPRSEKNTHHSKLCSPLTPLYPSATIIAIMVLYSISF